VSTTPSAAAASTGVVNVAVWDGADRRTLHTTLADALGVPAGELELDADARGKPFVRWPVTDLCFSVTHARGLSAVAHAWGRDVGIDAESLDRDVEGWTLWRHALSSRELAALDGEPEGGNAALLRAWVRKEALSKAVGLGLDLDPATVELSADGRILALPATLGEPAAWSLHDLAMPGYALSVACRPAARSVAVERARGRV
jgi:4'-phosphopantetheinyl transferase